MVSLNNPNWEVILSIFLPSKLVLSWQYQFLDFALKSPIVVIRNGFCCARISKIVSKLSEKAPNSSWDWLGDL